MKKYIKTFFSFHGRLERKPFIFYFIGISLLQIVAGSIVGISNFNTIISFIAIPLVVLALIAQLSVCVRRLHDMNRSSKILFVILLLFIFLSLIESFYFKHALKLYDSISSGHVSAAKLGAIKDSLSNDLLISQYLGTVKSLIIFSFSFFLVYKKGTIGENSYDTKTIPLTKNGFADFNLPIKKIFYIGFLCIVFIIFCSIINAALFI